MSHKEIAYKMFRKCIAVGNRRLSENNKKCLLQSGFLLFYISCAAASLWMLICIASTSLQRDAVAGQGWEWRDRLWPNPRDLSPGSSLRREEAGGHQVESLLRGSLLPAGGSPGHTSRFQGFLVFFHSMREMPSLCCREPSPVLLRQENKCICWVPGILSHFILYSTVFVSVVRRHLQNRLMKFLGGCTDPRGRWAAGAWAVGCSWGERRWCWGGSYREGPHALPPALGHPGLPLPSSTIPLSSEMLISNALYLHVLKRDLGRPLLVLLP